MAAEITIGDTPPPSPVLGDAWWDSVGTQLYVWVTDGDSAQWVVAVNQASIPGDRGARGPPGIGTGVTGVSISRTVGAMIAEARQLLNDVVPISGAPRFTDASLVSVVNEGLLQIRAKRPDAFLRYGLRIPLPLYSLPNDVATMLPIEDQFYSPLLFYVVGRSELTEDTFSDDSRAITMMSKFTSMLLKHTG